MRHLFVYILLSIVLIKVNASTIDSLLVKEYERGYEVVCEIIEIKCLKDSLSNRSFCSLFFENLWYKIEKNIYKPTDFYTPFYWYFVLTDSSHNRKFEWNAYSNSEDEYAVFCVDVISGYVVSLMNTTLHDKHKSRNRVSKLFRKS